MKIFVASSNRRCHSNAVEAAAALRYLEANGVELLGGPEGADLCLLLTCGSLGATRERTLKLLSETARRAAGAPVYAVGCMTAIDRAALDGLAAGGANVRVLGSLGGLDAVIGASRSYSSFRERHFGEELYSYLRDDVSPGYGILMKLLGRLAALPVPSRLRQKLECAAHINKFHVQIGSGCAGSCAYCVIKKARGAPVSRPVKDILADIALARKPGLTLSLVAEDCGSWGADTGSSLPVLLAEIRRAFPDLKIDLRYLNPAWLEKAPEEFLAALSAGNVNSVNLCAQSGSDRVLERMRRGYRTGPLLDFVGKLRAAAPGVLVRTHVITGFPGETWGDFLLTLKALRRFDMANAYLWSPPPGAVRSRRDTVNGLARKAAADLLNVVKLLF